MLLTMLFQATAAAAGVSKLGAALGAGLAVIGAGWVLVRLVVLPWRQLAVSPMQPEIFV